MANTRSAAKQARASLRRGAQNKSIKSRLHTLEKKFLAAVAAKKSEDFNELYRLLSSALDKAAVHCQLSTNNPVIRLPMSSAIKGKACSSALC